MMDQQKDSETLTSSSKLNAKAPEFVPRSSSAAVPQTTEMQHVYAPTPFMQPRYGYENQLPLQNYYQQSMMPFYECVNPVGSGELAGDRKCSAATMKSEMSDTHQKILNQVEFYFSDINLATTDQLFGFMSKDPEGYVPLSVVASFKKIKTGINGSTQLANILQSSRKLVVSEDGKKIKRQHPLTESDMEELQSRIVIAENLPEDHSHQNLMKIFSSVGSVKSIRTCPPQNSNSGASSASRAGKGDAMHFSGKFHAFVEYESVKVAEKAVVELTDEANWRNGLKVRFLIKSAVKSTQSRSKRVIHEVQSIGKKDNENHLEDSLLQPDNQIHELQLDDNLSSNSQRKGRTCPGGKGRGKGSGRGRAHNLMNGPLLEVSVSMEKLNLSKTSPVPRMPDGTKGFSMGRGKSLAIKTV